MRRALTCTTRPPRRDERPGVAYTFVTDAEFDALAASGDLLEQTEYKGFRYGVPAAEVGRGGEVVVVVDPPGIRHLRGRFGERVVAICLAGHGTEDLAARMAGRGSAPEEIEWRLRNLADEASALYSLCDHRIPPGSREDVLNAVEAVMEQARGRLARPR